MSIDDTRKKGVSSEDIVASIEMILGRTPDQSLVDYHLGLAFEDRFALGEYMMSTDEFRRRRTSNPQALFLGDRVMAQTHRGEIIYVAPTDLDLTPSMLSGGVHEPYVEKIIVRAIRKGDVAIDIGANVGYHTMAIAAAVGSEGRVHAFEANPVIMTLLKSSLVVNGLTSFRGTGRVNLYQNAVSDRSGVLILEQAPGHYGSGHIITEAPGSDFGPEYSTRVEVPTVRLDDVLAEVARVDFLHMDIEGAEPLAMAGARNLLDRSPDIRIVTEWSVNMMRCLGDVEEYIQSLIDRDFRFWHIAHDGRLSPVSATELINLPHSDLFIARSELS